MLVQDAQDAPDRAFISQYKCSSRAHYAHAHARTRTREGILPIYRYNKPPARAGGYHQSTPPGDAADVIGQELALRTVARRWGLNGLRGLRGLRGWQYGEVSPGRLGPWTVRRDADASTATRVEAEKPVCGHSECTANVV